MLILARQLRCITIGAFFVACGGVAFGAEDISSTVAGHLQQGKVGAAEKFLQERLKAEPKHDQARFALGVVEVLSAVEKLAQDQYRYGALNGGVRNVPVMRIPVPINPNPQSITYQQLRQIFVDFQTRILKADAELAKIDLSREVKLPFDLMSIRLDLTGDGMSDTQESFLDVLGAVNRTRPGEARPDMRVTFDNGDVPWLRGYCNFLAAFCDMVLAYDHQNLFDHTGQLIYPKHVRSEKFTAELDAGVQQDFTRQIVDFIAAIHLINLPLQEPARMESARKHFLEMIRTSRQSWALIGAETDNDHEWLPNPKQTGVLRVPITREVIDGWHGVLNEMEDLLEGRKLVPFWRDYVNYLGAPQKIPAEGRGINIKKFFSEPRQFDLILTIQGTGMLPYIERGKLSHPDTWQNLTRVFQGQFFGFAMWFN